MAVENKATKAWVKILLIDHTGFDRWQMNHSENIIIFANYRVQPELLALK